MLAELANLPAELREVIEAVHYRDLTFRQAAIELGITQHQVRTRQERALALLRPHLQTIVADGEGI